MKILNIITSAFLILSIYSCTNKNQSNYSKVPAWSKEAVWYQIFPERFRNGDKSNDPALEDMTGSWPYHFTADWKISPWTSDWYKLNPWEKNTGKDFYWNVNTRRYGGDLQGVLDKLDYLKELGVNAIYFNPLFESPSLHKYDASMYHHIDNNFGPDPEGDRKIWKKENPGDPATWQMTSADKLFLKLLAKCHEQNIKVIIDGVFNHVGTSFWAFEDVVKNQEKSKYKDWFIINKWDDPETDKNEFEYAGWYGVKDLPEFREDENGLVRGPREHIHSIIKRWMDPNGDGNPSDGIDGWRLDVAEMVKINFWKDFRKWVKAINPDAYITGEIWWDDWKNNKMMNAAPWLKGDTFDAVMNYRFTRAVKHFVSDVKNKITPQEFIDSLNNIRRDYPPENLQALMNLLGSHDTERLASLIVNPDNWYDHAGNPSQNPNFDIRKPNETERMKQKLMVGIQMTLPGAPMVYYGDEAGMWGGDDPDCRKPMVWQDMKYETETTHPFNKPRPKDEVSFDSSLFNWYKNLISIRNDNKALSLGKLDFFFIDNDKYILCYSRKFNREGIYILLNNKNMHDKLVLDNSNFKRKQELTDLVTGNTIENDGNKFSFKLSPYQILVLK